METIRIKKRLESETLHLPELRPLIGHEVEITVTEPCARSPHDAQPEAAASILELARQAAARIPADVLRRLPRDGSTQLDHYLYGTPKRA